MKDFDSLTHEEKAELTDEQINYYIDRECAERGIALLPPGGPPVKPDKGVTADDLALFEVGGFYFISSADAHEVAEAINKAQSRVELNYISGPSYRKYAEPSTTLVQPARTTALSQELRAKLGSIIETQERAAKEYQEEKAAYDKIERNRKSVVDEIREAITTSRRRMARKSELAIKLSRYVELAGGDQLIAARFIRQAEPDVVEFFPELRVDQEYRMVTEKAPEPMPEPDDDITF